MNGSRALLDMDSHSGHSIATDKLSALEEEIYFLYEHVPFGSHALDAKGTYLHINTVELSWLGYPRNEIVGRRKFIDFLTPDSQKSLLKQLPLLELSTTIFQLELDLIRRDGTTMPVALSSVGFAVDSGKLLKHRAVIFDMREEQINKGHEVLTTKAFESLSGMFITDNHKAIIQVNNAFTDLTGYSSAEATGETADMLNAGNNDATFYQAMWANINEQGHWRGETQRQHKDGTIFTVWLSISTVLDASSNITNYIGSFVDITSTKLAKDQLTLLAYFDPLTQLPNRLLILDRLTQAQAAGERTEFHSAVLFIDLDHFKAINDAHGHGAGDLVLVETAQRLREAVRAGDSIARIGGDEFVVLLEGLSKQPLVSAAQVQSVADKLLVSLAKPYQFSDYEFYCSASIGGDLFVSGVTPTDLIHRADLAMYQSKADGGNRFQFFDQDMQTRVSDLASLEADLRQALKLDQFKLFFQPQVNLQDQVIGAEAMLRWQHPVRGLVSPTEFIDLAEHTGLIVPIGHWVMQKVCSQLKEWSTKPLTSQLRLSVNVSAHQYRSDDFAESVAQLMNASAINAAQLVLEITESMILDVPDAIEKMHVLKKLGLSISMDDFGTGYSSLSSLTKLPLSELKIDQSFVSNLGNDSNDTIVVKAVILMGRALGLEVIAEGVETLEQRDILIEFGCQQLQGYLFGRPAPIEEFETLLLASGGFLSEFR